MRVVVIGGSAAGLLTALLRTVPVHAAWLDVLDLISTVARTLEIIRRQGAGPAAPSSVLGYCGIARKPLPG